MLEVTIMRVATVSMANRAAVGRPGAALVARQEAKRADYGVVAPHRVVVWAMDEYGMLSPDAWQLLRGCAALRGDRLDLEHDDSTWAARTFSAFWRQRLSVAFARAKADVILQRARADWLRGQ